MHDSPTPNAQVSRGIDSIKAQPLISISKVLESNTRVDYTNGAGGC